MKIGILDIIKSNYFRILKNLKFFLGFTRRKMEKESLTDMKRNSFTHNRYIHGQNKNSNYFLLYYSEHLKGKKKTNYGMYGQKQRFSFQFGIIHFL